MDRMQRIVKREEGFSLIEVIVAVAILAILSMPILLYFTNSAVQSANGRYEQAADMAAQTVVEEIDSVDNFDYIENALVNNGNNWNISSLSPDINGKTVLTRPVSVNGNNYIADVTIDYGAYGSALAGPTAAPDATPIPTPPAGATPTPDTGLKAKFNNYQNPHFRDLYSDESVVISEKSDTFNSGVYNLYHEINGVAAGVTPPPSAEPFDSIKNKTKKIYKLTAVPYPEGMFTVKGSCVFYIDKEGSTSGFDDSDYSAEIVLTNTQIEKSKLKSIYFLFSAIYGVADKESESSIKQSVIVDFSAVDDETLKNLEISFIRQNDYAEEVDKNKTYELIFDTTRCVNYLWSKYYNNDKVNLNGPTYGGGLMNKTQDKRIAYVKVEIYRSDESGNKEGSVLATNTTSKTV